MKSATKLLGAIALTATLAGAAIAGPSNPTASFASRAGKIPGCPHVKAQTALVAAANPKVNAPVQKTTGYVHKGCTGTDTATMTCGASKASCAAMRNS